MMSDKASVTCLEVKKEILSTLFSR